ncbi:sigma 54-interacting transcriptional regulator [Amphritea sp.]|uniref:sigma-54 interaction domain-containing protein n=1 Tax=Amphritea sp. TaxID=1872502 RepID=UPI0025B99135|nr:sigma 54-interacting transcriptional regulator [Amphritea sp.]
MSQLETLINTSDENLLTLLSSLCQGAIAIDQECRIVWLSQQYRELMELPDNTEFIGQLVNDILPTTQLPRILKTGQPSFLDLMQINNRWCAVTRLPLKNPDGSVFGAIGFVFYDDLENLQPLFDKFARLKKQLVSENLLRTSKYELDDLIGNSPALLKIKRQALRSAQLDTTILLLGETGTGKELLAQGIHNASPRSDAPFVGINMAALPESLVEAELFGTAAGAYTGASKNGRLGKIQLAAGGTLFLDEIADISAAIQAKLLRVIQEREVEALGSNRLEKVDVRIIAATSQDLKQLVDKGLFRADLYYRLNVLPLQLPALRERATDIPALSSYLMKKIAHESGLPALNLSQDALSWLQHYHWPGNVRELHNRLERACVMAEQELISAEDLGADDLNTGPPVNVFSDFNQIKHHAEAEALQQALTQCQHNKTKAARLLGISRATLYNRIKRLNM